jgi:hypothetical protein
MIRKLLAICLLFAAQTVIAQELEPRRWSHLPVGANFISLASFYKDQKILFDPTLELEDVEGDLYTAAVGYVRVFDVLGKSGRIDMVLPYTTARWEGLLEGMPASTRRRGFNDPNVRFAVNLVGSPAQRGEEFQRYVVDTIVGAAVDITVPVGEYRDDKLINLGDNRWVLKPQLGVVHNWDKWAAEVTASVWFYQDNDDFFGGRTLEQDPLYGVQTHLIYTFRPGLWASASAAYGAGGQRSVDSIDAPDRTSKTLLAISAGVPIDRKQGVKATYLRGDTRENTGSDDNLFLFAYSLMWGGE